MKNIFYILLLLPTIIFAQYQGNANQKITLGEQTTADGLVYRGVASTDTVTATSKITRANKQDTSAYILLDTVTNLLWHYKIGSNAWTQAGGSTFDTTTLNLVSRFGLKLNISDTATMLLPYYSAGKNTIIKAADVPTLNQNTTGSAATLTTGRTIQTNLASTSAATFNGSANITPGITGTLGGANGGTGLTTFGAAGNIPFASSTTALKTNSRFKITEAGSQPTLDIDGRLLLKNQSPFAFYNKTDRYYIAMIMFDTSSNLVFQNMIGSDLLLMNGVTRNIGIRYNAKDSAQVTEALTVSGNGLFTGNLGVGGATPTTSGTGITFPATQSGSTNVNTLDDYEEGSWTPIYRGLAGSNGSLAYSVQRGRYTKVGRFVHASGEITLTNKGSWTSGVEIAGLPFTTTAAEFTFGFIDLGFVDFAPEVKYCQFVGTGAANNQAYIDTIKDNLDREILFTSAVNNNSSFSFSFIYTTSN